MKMWIVRDARTSQRLGVVEASDAMQACINYRCAHTVSYAIKLTASKYYA